MIVKIKHISFLLILSITSALGQENQISIPRINLMPDQPTPYLMRDWKQVAINYDRFVYDFDKNGEYLPVISIKPEGNNYPERPTFGFHTYIGTNNPNGHEAINIMPSIVGATLVGIDKSNQDGHNYVLMAQDFFNKKNGQNLYLNSNSAKSGNDWWYDMMPNLFFYQLYDLYPNMGGEAEQQFSLIAANMLEAVQAMGGSAAPWSVPFMTYRAWKFETMEPNIPGVPEPEAAGVFSWLLYSAYIETGIESYRIGAEWAMEYLSNLNGNPSYELQLPYGTYVAARMNAEIGTTYDIEKMVNWSFDKGNLRGWGTIVDKWSGIDVSGLVGESESSTDYAFQLNGVQQAAALVPMVRYDKRFATDIAKWVLNLANATRLFYHGYLPSSLQDASEWSQANDPNRVIGYEAIREIYNGLSPFATGDAVNGGWAATNLALYGTSSIGYLGSIIETTNVAKVLKIDLLKTDFFRDEAYPTYLIFNSYSTNIEVELETGSDLVDIYDPLTESFLAKGVSGQVLLPISPLTAIMPVITPADGQIKYQKNKMLINDVVVDYDQHQESYSAGPRIKALSPDIKEVLVGTEIKVYATVEFSDNHDELFYIWKVNDAPVENNNPLLTYTPEETGEQTISVIVTSPDGQADTAYTMVSVVPEINLPPSVYAIEKSATYGSPGSIIDLMAVASEDIDGPLLYEWSVSGGSIQATGKEAEWVLPEIIGVYEISVTVTDTTNLSSTYSEPFLVTTISGEAGNLIAHYPLDGNGQDFSGNELDGTIVGAVPTVNNLGESNSAYFFNGSSHHMVVDTDPILNFQKGITVSGWFKPTSLPDRESFIISHGSWQNRWKISIIPEGKLRWTVNTLNGISDLDTQNALEKDTFYHMVATYDGTFMLLYINGVLNNFTLRTGDMRTTSFPLFLAQSLPGEQNYNFQGVLDEFRIYDYSISPDQAQSLFANGTLTNTEEVSNPFYELTLSPNPVEEQITITGKDLINMDEYRIYNMEGQFIQSGKIQTSFLQIPFYTKSSGAYIIQFSSNGQLKNIQKFIKN